YTCTLTGPGTNVAVPCAAGANTVDLTGRADGTYTLTVTQTDAAGNTGPAGTWTYLLDTTAPPAPGLNGPAGPSKNRPPPCTLTGPGTTVPVPSGAGSTTVNLTGRADGTYTLPVTQTDAAGNTGPAGTWTYLLDTTAPAAPGLTGPGGPSKNRQPTVALSGE